MRSTLLALALTATPVAAVAGEKDTDATQGVHEVKADDELVVYGDLFARWDGTRWYIATEIQMPNWLTWAANQNYEMRVGAFQVRAVLACEKSWRISGKRFEVDCAIEDIGIQAAVNEKGFKHAQEILQEMDAKLTGAAVQLQVRDNGRVTNIDLEGVPPGRNRRENQIQETLRLILARLVVGYDMKLRKSNFLATGQWVENRSTLLSMPSATTTPSSGLIVHQLNGYKGHVVVQTRGEGQILGDNEVAYKAELTGVSIYDEDQGFMTERVWSLNATPTAESFVQYAGAIVAYHHSGILRMLGDEERVNVGPTREVAVAGAKPNLEGLPAWEPLQPEG